MTHCEQYMVALSWLNVEHSKECPPLSSADLLGDLPMMFFRKTTVILRKLQNHRKIRKTGYGTGQNMRELKVPEWTTHNYTSANSLSHSLYIFSMRTYRSPHMQHKTYIYG